MKSMRINIFLLAAFALTACTREIAPESTDLTTPDPVPARIVAAIPTATKADGNLWTADRIGVIVTSPKDSVMATEYRNVGYETEATGVTTATFTAINTDDAIVFRQANEVSFVAYAPYDNSTGADEYPGSDGTFTFSTEDQSTTAKQTSVDWLYATATAMSGSPEVALEFSHAMSRIVFDFVSDGFTSSDFQDGVFTLSGIVHEGTFNVITGETSTAGDAVSRWSLMDNATWSTSDNELIITAYIIPQTPAELLFRGVIGDYTIPTVPEIDLLDFFDGDSFEAGHSYEFTINVKKYVDPGTSPVRVKTTRM